MRWACVCCRYGLGTRRDHQRIQARRIAALVTIGNNTFDPERVACIKVIFGAGGVGILFARSLLAHE